MANSQSTLPEGTDSILTGAMNDEGSGESFDAGGTGATGAPDSTTGSSTSGSGASAKLGEAAAKVGDATASLRAQAADKARDYAAQGKDRAVGALENVTRLVDDAASTIDEKVGEQYGAYARRASEAVAGLADTLRTKDVDELFADARDVVRKSPAIAIGAAAAIGFVIARMIKAGVPDTAPDTADQRDAVDNSFAKASSSTATNTVPVDPNL